MGYLHSSMRLTEYSTTKFCCYRSKIFDLQFNYNHKPAAVLVPDVICYYDIVVVEHIWVL